MSKKEESPYKNTVNLPKTDFPMKADLVIREPQRLGKWESSRLYHRIQARRKAQHAPRYLLHDGPPFANGDVHMGTALNKILKDLVLKSKTMAGFETPYVPGWDCHGLPIEFKVVKEAAGLSPVEVRTRAEEFARKYIDIQRNSFRRLGVFGDWDNPYLTLDAEYEAHIIRFFATCVEKDLVYRSRRPVLWSYGAQTALAEAEVEYKDKVSPSVYVKFPVADRDYSMVIWTTTPWTLPANLGIAVHPQFTYVIGDFGGHKLIVAKSLLASFEEKTGLRLAADTAVEVKGDTLAGAVARHPFLDRTSKIILGDFVTDDTGTGQVHIAPGHGMDDYIAGRENNLGLLSPVDDNGKFTDEVGVPELAGMHVFAANKHIIEMLRERGVLLGHEEYAHQYPHCWRSKSPVIFRAVEQFFLRIDAIRQTALEQIDKVGWIPHWGRNRIHGTVESRPDWCISRQRTWGVPLPVFYAQSGEVILDGHLARRVADLIARHGTNYWFEKSDAELVTELGLPAGSRKGRDTLDVWIDSGCSSMAVTQAHPELGNGGVADLYLEATDQHRGWFQSSLMCSVIHRGTAPYKNVLTHGFVTDTSGNKVSKSDQDKNKKPMVAEYYYNNFGADMVRLWVASVDYRDDVPFSEDLFKQTAEVYRRIRNTLRILLANLGDFDAASHAVTDGRLTTLDQWILERLHAVTQECTAAYAELDFRRVYTAINQFCAVDLSALYVDATKDRMYCDAVNSPRRRAAQTAMHRVLDALCRLLAPILAYTADEAWEHAGHPDSVHLEDFPAADAAFAGSDATETVGELLKIRSVLQQEIEKARQEKIIGSNLDAEVQITIPAGTAAEKALLSKEDAAEFFILSDFALVSGDKLAVTARRSPHGKCDRCWKCLSSVGSHPAHPALCHRCAAVVVAQTTP
ncbi:MAG: isoleucine--tRNA ligase [Verrucomicrobiales bacterium]|nr:isoleucine--tRNA ligase [Verrucomicrobiales bacterium]